VASTRPGRRQDQQRNAAWLGSDRIEHVVVDKDIPRSNDNSVSFSATNAENMSIEGRGASDGNGAKIFTG
jgi:hypothetical protein